MGNFSSFVDAIYASFERTVRDPEEDQKLPAPKVLEDVCQTLFYVSCMREEGRFPSFRVCFIRPGSDLLDTYIYAHALYFDTPIEFSTRELHKLAPALNADMSYLMLDISQKPYKITGILAAYTTWEKILTRQISSGNRMPQIPNILVNGPGDLKACFGEAPLVSFSAGRAVTFRTDTFTSTLVAGQLRNGSRIPDEDRLRLLYRILWQVAKYRHGAAVMITPSAEACEEFVDYKYRMECRFLFESDDPLQGSSNVGHEKEIVTYADLIAKLTSVDGSVILTKDFDLLGFGAETLVDKMDSKQPHMSFIGYDNKPDVRKHFKDQGMRHRAAYRFCSAVPDSVAFVVSQDGSIEACTTLDGRVIVYDRVALPLA